MKNLSVDAIVIVLLFQFVCGCGTLLAHGGPFGDTHTHDHPQRQSRDAQTHVDGPGNRPESQRVGISLDGPQVQAFAPFSESVSVRIVGQHLVVDSNGLPGHPMMIGIRSWQQQVPLPQPFTGENAWRLPLNPRLASKPISVLKEPLRGAIALAVNGVPVFCALNNRGEDTLLAGELDDWGGHCGRGDDYHYHIAPVHLEATVGKGNPIAYALDGFPIVGFTEADGSDPKDLDQFNGHEDSDGNYHYHATQTFPYINGGLRGVVTMDGDQVAQPRDSPVRPGQSPLKGALITDFTRNGDQFDLQYERDGKLAHVKYKLLEDDRVEFSFVNSSGDSTSVVYRRGQDQSFRPITGYAIAILLVIGLCALGIAWRKQFGPSEQ